MARLNLSGQWSGLRQLPGADGPVLRWGIVCIVVILLWSSVLAPWQASLQRDREMLSSRMMEAARLQALQSQTDVWRQAEAQFDKAVAAALQGLSQHSTATMAQSELQGLLQQLTQAHRLKIESQHFLPAEDEPGLGKRVAVQLRLVGAMADAFRFLDALARHQRLMIIEKLHMGRRGGGDMWLFVQVAGFMAAPEERE